MYATQAQTGVYERRSANVNANVRSCNPFYRAAHGTGAVHFRAAEPRRSELRRAAPCPALSSTNEHRDGCTARLPDIQKRPEAFPQSCLLEYSPALMLRGERAAIESCRRDRTRPVHRREAILPCRSARTRPRVGRRRSTCLERFRPVNVGFLRRLRRLEARSFSTEGSPHGDGQAGSCPYGAGARIAALREAAYP